MKSLRKATRAWSRVAYQSITASKLAVLRTTWANFCGEIRCEDAGRTRDSVVTVAHRTLLGVGAPDGSGHEAPGRARQPEYSSQHSGVRHARLSSGRGEP